MQVGRTSHVYHSTHKCCFSIRNLCILAHLGKRGEEGGKCTSTLVLHSSTLRMRRRSKKEEVQGQKVSVPKMRERSCPEDEGSQLSPECQNVLL